MGSESDGWVRDWENDMRNMVSLCALRQDPDAILDAIQQGGSGVLIEAEGQLVAKAFRTAFGLCAITFNSTSAGPCGLRSPLSQCRRVAVEKPNRAANSSCVSPVLARTALTSTALGL